MLEEVYAFVLLQNIWSERREIEQLKVNMYTPVQVITDVPVVTFCTREQILQLVKEVLRELSIFSAVGPDLISNRVLKRIAGTIAPALALLIERILQEGIWPTNWRDHWLIPIFKRGALSDAGNYRGIRLTSHISKVVEKVLKILLQPYLTSPLLIAEIQFVY